MMLSYITMTVFLLKVVKHAFKLIPKGLEMSLDQKISISNFGDSKGF